MTNVSLPLLFLPLTVLLPLLYFSPQVAARLLSLDRRTRASALPNPFPFRRPPSPAMNMRSIAKILSLSPGRKHVDPAAALNSPSSLSSIIRPPQQPLHATVLLEAFGPSPSFTDASFSRILSRIFSQYDVRRLSAVERIAENFKGKEIACLSSLGREFNINAEEWRALGTYVGGAKGLGLLLPDKHSCSA